MPIEVPGPDARKTHPTASDRVSVRALIIGNEEYAESPLHNPAKDAKDFARVARQIGYDAEAHVNLGRRKMQSVIDDFSDQVTPRDGVLFFYSGHGSECDDDNWLIPVDCDSFDDRNFKRKTIAMREVFGAFKKARFRIIILDACRTNPFRGATRGTSGGLGAAQLLDCGTDGDLICMATGPRDTAFDGRPGHNGIFTAALLKHFKTPGASITQIMQLVRRDVKEETKGRQVPWEHSSLMTDWYPAGRPNP
jgi:uncharacterized caspase-like protein